MKTHLFAITALFLILCCSSCQKKPTASFSTDKDTYNKGEYMQLTNDSKDADTYVWIVKGPQETRSVEFNTQVQLPTEGTYEVTLACYSKNGRLSDKAIKTITVKGTSGVYTFYSDDLYGSTAAVYLDNVYQGSITQEWSSATCGQAGCVTFTIPPGSHQVKATLQAFAIDKTYTITPTTNSCNPFYIYF